MPTAHEVALELRKLADSLDASPEVEVVQPYVSFYCKHSRKPKNFFLAIAGLLPRPLKKSVDTYGTDPNLNLEYRTPAITIAVSTPKSLLCTLVEPAKAAVYDCHPILSMDEDKALDETLA